MTHSSKVWCHAGCLLHPIRPNLTHSQVLGWTHLNVATPLWPSVGVKPNTSKVGDLESSRTPECLEFNNKAQNTLHWSVLSVIEKVLKRRYRKWPLIGHLDMCCPSYGQKKGRESNCDALPSHRVKPTWGFHKVKLRKVKTWRHATGFQL
jgi:hypothetical protein